MNSISKYFLLGFLLLSFSALMIGQSSLNPLPDCPKSPNCFASQVGSKNWKKKPLLFNGTLEVSIEKLLDLLDAMPGATHVSSDRKMIQYTFQTKVGKFIDDVHFSVDEKNKRFHFRSASRKGYSDMGANKRRMKKIRRLWEDNSQ